MMLNQRQHEDRPRVKLSSEKKFDRLALIGSLLPNVRRRWRRDLAAPKLSKDKVTAAVIRLIDKTHTRVGNPKYALEHGSHGATTLTAEHVFIDDMKISLDYPGKSGQQRELSISAAKVCEVIQECEEIGGQYLFSARDESGQFNPSGSADVNDYLCRVAGETLTAKDCRTWWGSGLALHHLQSTLGQGDAIPTKKLLVSAIEKTAKDLGHAPAVCRQSYIHPGLISAAENDRLAKLIQNANLSNKAPRADLTRD